MIIIEIENAFYANVDPRRKQELADARRVQEDHSSVANLSPVAYQMQFDPNAHVERLSMYNQSQPMRRRK